MKQSTKDAILQIVVASSIVAVIVAVAAAIALSMADLWVGGL